MEPQCYHGLTGCTYWRAGQVGPHHAHLFASHAANGQLGTITWCLELQLWSCLIPFPFSSPLFFLLRQFVLFLGKSNTEAEGWNTTNFIWCYASTPSLELRVMFSCSLPSVDIWWEGWRTTSSQVHSSICEREVLLSCSESWEMLRNRCILKDR